MVTQHERNVVNGWPSRGLPGLPLTRQAAIGLLLVAALFAFELFNFDTTRYALDNLLGGVGLGGFGWADILAFAFCSIDFAGLAWLFTPANRGSRRDESAYLMGAWLLGATLNALMTWWAITLLLLGHPFTGNEVLSHAQLVNMVPIFVAIMVWLTRILFIGALSVAEDHLFSGADGAATTSGRQRRDPAAKVLPASAPSDFLGRVDQTYETGDSVRTTEPLRKSQRGGQARHLGQSQRGQPRQTHSPLLARPRRPL